MEYCAILIPCYNEEKTIRKVVRDWKKEIPEATIYVYDNNSTDNTAKIAKEEGAVVRREYKQGKGNVIRRMFREIDAQCYIMIDGDDTYPVEYGRQMMQEVLENTQIDESRILTEAAIFADKVVVDEETVRLRSHLSQLEDMLEQGGAVGRKLDFLIQEFNREANTIGSKCSDVALSRVVVELKGEIEKIREQVQNIE